MTIKKKKAIVLSGGGTRGAYQAGILKYIIENWGLQFDVVVGTSIGALNGLLYSTLNPMHSNEINANKMISPWTDISFLNILKIPFEDYINGKFNAIFDNKQLQKYLEPFVVDGNQKINLKNGSIETVVLSTSELKSTTPHIWYATNNKDVSLKSERWTDHKLDELKLEHAIASSAIPIVFKSILLEDEKGRTAWHNDGGVLLNTPISPAIKAGSDKILAIYLGNPNEQQSVFMPSALEALTGAVNTIGYSYLKEDIVRANSINYLLEKIGKDEFEGYKKIDLKVVRPEINIDNYMAGLLSDLKNKNFFTRFFVPKFLLEILSFTTLFMDKVYTNPLIELGYRNAKSMHDELDKFFTD